MINIEGIIKPKKRNFNYLYSIGDSVNGVVITKLSRLKSVKAYQYECPICGYIGEKSEGNFKAGQGCGGCFGHQTLVKGYNDIATTDPWMIEWMVNKEDSKKYKAQSHSKILFKCIYCGCEKLRKIDHFYKRKLGCCNDGISYPNKFMFNLLQQLDLNFKPEYKFKSIKSKRYDFFFELDNELYLLEAHGIQHYEKSFSTIKGAKTLEEEQNNDKLKKELAIQNGIKPKNYIVIDCRKSTLDWIRDNKNGILNSRLNELFDLSKIDWNKCGEFACSNRVKEACELWNTHNFKFAIEIAEHMNINNTTAQKYLVMGKELNWCDYDVEEVKTNQYIKAVKASSITNSKLVYCLENKKLYKSTSNCAEQGLKDFGEKMNANGISRACKGIRSYYKGYHFKYISDLTSEEYILYNIENILSKNKLINNTLDFMKELVYYSN